MSYRRILKIFTFIETLIFGKFKKEFLNFQLERVKYSEYFESGNSETWKRSNFEFWVIEVLCS